MNLLLEKTNQAIEILKEKEIDLWLTFVRETTGARDPVLPLILGRDLTWQSALLVTRGGERVAIVGNFDADAIRALDTWPSVVPYVQSIRGELVETLKRLDPRLIAINYSENDVKADGLSLGMYRVLCGYLRDTPFAERLVSAERLIGALRGRKTDSEVGLIRAAVACAESIFEALPSLARVGMSEAEIARLMRELAADSRAAPAWNAEQCPIVNSGPQSMVGHGVPSEDIRVEPGHILHVDFGVQLDGYCSDLQRCWYVPRPNESGPPAEVKRAFETVVEAIRSAAKALKPGAVCWEVDAAARGVITAAGFREYLHATGHHVGQAAHDGGGVIGPRWERYGETPNQVVESGNVFTLELGVDNVAGCGYVGLEEMVLVTASGCEFLSSAQTKLGLLGR